MKAKHQYLLVFYWMALLADAYYIYEADEQYRWLTKGALMPLLLLFYLLNASRKHHTPSKVITLLAILSAWAGDIALLGTSSGAFITGVAFFLVMQVLYSIYFYRVHRPFPVKDSSYLVIPFIIMLAVAGVVTRMIWPSLGDLKVPVIIYMAVIAVMFILACNILASKKSNTLAQQFFIPGAILFVASDSLLAINKFLWEETIVNVAIILTYGYAQQLLVQGFVKHVKGRV